MDTKHRIEVKNDHLHATFSRDYKPILIITSGDSVQYKTPDIDWGYTTKEGDRTLFESREKETIWGHPIIGPIAIKNAKPGMTLEIRINDIVPSWYGWNSAGGNNDWHNDKLGLSELDALNVDWVLEWQKNKGICTNKNKSFSVKLNPFMGVMGTAPSEQGIHSTIPPRYCGGNIDCKELTKGSILYLPIAVEGGLFSVGDGHAAQGDGEVSGTAIECPMELVDLTFILRKDLSLQLPRAYTPSGWVTFGFHEDLNEATIMALNEMLQLIQELYHVDKLEATALASVVVDLRITQIVNKTKGVHAVLPHGSIEQN
ncbi:acetamidase/formamidase family protein [Bacillus salipaludis]|uniref:acetamidase/formamidase family protein n=1 Tax=Bacillus salipaludis TaxID=2547811 RepID=UPI002E200411|nr:acetamidase/formamidase family protein [Bacillus salipaludis]